MMKRLLCLTVAIVLPGCASFRAAEPDRRATPVEVVAKVREAAVLLSERGDDGLQVVGDPTSTFTWKDTYVFVVDCDADRVLANSIFPERVGGDIKRHTDYAGKIYGLELCEVAKRPGGGWVEYVWPRPGSAVPSRKVSFVLSVPGRSYQVGAGVYDDDLTLADLERLTKE